LAADIVHRRGKNTFAAEVAFNGTYSIRILGPADFGVALGVGTKINQHTIKARVNPLDQSIAFAVKGKLHDMYHLPFTIVSGTPWPWTPKPSLDCCLCRLG
jgi:hypothetical protein